MSLLNRHLFCWVVASSTTEPRVRDESLSPAVEVCLPPKNGNVDFDIFKSPFCYNFIEKMGFRLPDGSVRGGMYGGGGIPRMTSRSATATPTGSPKRRHLPQIPSALQQTSFARVRQVTNHDQSSPLFWPTLTCCGATGCGRKGANAQIANGSSPEQWRLRRRRWWRREQQ